MSTAASPFSRHSRFEGVFLRPIVTAADSVKLATVEALIVPDHAVEPHAHEASDEHFFFMDGSGEVFDGTTWQPVTSGDAVTVKAGTSHAVRSTGRAPLRYLATYCPPLS